MVIQQVLLVTAVSMLLIIPPAQAFQPFLLTKRSRHPQTCCVFMTNEGRRAFMASTGASFACILVAPRIALAGIDVSSLRTDGGVSLSQQLKAYDGSAATRVQEIKAETTSSAMKVPPVAPDAVQSSAATTALRSSLGLEPKLTKIGIGALYRYQDQLAAPTGSRSRYIYITFEFPSDWLQLDRMLGGIQYVDQRNGDKLYVLRASLPVNSTLATVPKQFFGDSIFDQQGSIVRGGTTVEDYRVTTSSVSSQIISCPEGACTSTRRRLTIKYATVTGNGLRVERRALVDAYEVDSVVYMLVTSSNAVKFEAKGKERETVEAIVDSFRLER